MEAAVLLAGVEGHVMVTAAGSWSAKAFSRPCSLIVVPLPGWQLAAKLHQVPAAHANWRCAHSNMACADQHRTRHPHVIQTSQRRPRRWQGARQLVVVKVPAFSLGAKHKAGVEHGHSIHMGARSPMISITIYDVDELMQASTGVNAPRDMAGSCNACRRQLM
jgi:hypothetical protein